MKRLTTVCPVVSEINFRDVDVFKRILLKEADILVLSGSLIEGFGTPTSDFDFCVIAQAEDERFHRESFDKDRNLRFYTSGDRVKASFDYLEGCKLGVDVEYRTLAEIEGMINRLDEFYHYLYRRARKYSSFAPTGIDFRLLARLTYAEPMQNEGAFKRIRERLNIDKICYCLYRTAVGSYPDFRDIVGFWDRGDYVSALLQARKFATDNFRGLTHLMGNTNTNVKYLTSYAGKYLVDNLSDLREQFRVLTISDMTLAGSEKQATLAWMSLVEQVFQAISNVRAGLSFMPSAKQFIASIKKEINPKAVWHEEVSLEYVFRLKEVRSDLPTVKSLLELGCEALEENHKSLIKDWFAEVESYGNGEDQRPFEN